MNFVVQKGHNIAILMKNEQNILAPADQFRSRMRRKDIEIDKESEIDNQEREKGTSESSYETEQSMDENAKKSDDELEGENELRLRSPIRRSTQDTFPKRPFRFPRVFKRSQRSMKDIKPFQFREM